MSSRRGKGGRQSFTTRVIKAISPVNHISQTLARHISGYAVDANTGLRCNYFTAFAADAYEGSRNPFQLIRMANYGSQNARVLPIEVNAPDYTAPTSPAIGLMNGGADLRVIQTGFNITHRIINQCNFAIRLVAYLCSPKYTVGATGQNVDLYPLNALGMGFAQTGYGTLFDSSNGGLTNPAFSPFMSPEFIRRYRIHSVSSKYLQPADFKDFKIVDKKPFTTIPSSYLQPSTSAQIYDTAARTIEHFKGEKFYLFRTEPAQTGENQGQEDVTQIGLNVHCLSKLRYDFKTYIPVKGNTNTLYSTYGYVAPIDVSQVNIVNDETNAGVNAAVL